MGFQLLERNPTVQRYRFWERFGGLQDSGGYIVASHSTSQGKTLYSLMYTGRLLGMPDRRGSPGQTSEPPKRKPLHVEQQQAGF